MKTTHHDRYPTATELGGDLIGAFGGVRLHAHGYQVRGLVEGNRLGTIVVKADLGLTVTRRQSSESRGCERLHLPRADIGLANPPSNAWMH